MRKIHSSDETSKNKLPAFKRGILKQGTLPSGTDLEKGPMQSKPVFLAVDHFYSSLR